MLAWAECRNRYHRTSPCQNEVVRPIAALLQEVDVSYMRLKPRLVSIERQSTGRLNFRFEDGFEAVVDLFGLVRDERLGLYGRPVQYLKRQKTLP